MDIQTIPEEFKEFSEALEKDYKLSNELVFIAEPAKPWESKLGGVPYLESPDDYPTDEYGDPMMFYVQLNLDEMPPLPGFPNTGLLQFYVGNHYEYMMGLDEPCRVIYIEKYQKDETKLVSLIPNLDEEHYSQQPFANNCRIDFIQRKMLPTESSMNDTIEEIREAVSGTDKEDTFYSVFLGEGSRVSGYPFFVQSQPECYDEGKARIILLQLDSDSVADMMFGDAGTCQFMISEEDLKNKNFTNVYYDWACG